MSVPGLSTTPYARPRTVAEAAGLLAGTDGARPIAGGTDLMVQLRLGHRTARLAVDVSRLDELHRLDRADSSIGAAVTVRVLLESPWVRERCPGLVQAGELLGGRQIQAMATIGGNLCNASPAAELATPLLVHDAEVVVAGLGGDRTLPLSGFWLGPGRTVLERGELLKAVRPRAVVGRSAYRRIELRRSVDIAVVGVAARLHLIDGVVAQARVAIGAAAPVPRLVPGAADVLEGVEEGEPLDAAIAQAAVRARDAAEPIDDTRASARYRTAMIEVLTRRALQACRVGEGMAA